MATQAVNWDRIHRAIRAALASAKTPAGRSRIECVEWAHGICEPGYTDEPAVFGNWNSVTRWQDGKSVVLDDTPERLGRVLENLGLDLHWSDGWTTCGECGKAVRTQPDCWHWTPYYDETGIENGELVCLDCHKPAEPEEGDTDGE